MSQYFSKDSRYTERTIEKDYRIDKGLDDELLDGIQGHEQAMLTIILLSILLHV